MSSHAKLSASGSHIWLSCPAAIKMQENFKNEDTDFTKEGTAAHALAELMIQKKVGMKVPAKALKEAKASEYYNEAMQSYIDDYSDWVIEDYNRIKADCPDAILFTEQKLDYGEWVKDGFGTGDVIIIADGTLSVIDLKYGKGVPVSAVDNPQLKLYGLGAYAAYDLMYDIEKLRLVIHQPRLDSVSVFELTVEELLKWAEETVRPAAELALKGTGAQIPGEHCRFCRASAICRARADEAAKIAAEEFADPDTLSDEEIADWLGMIGRITDWCGKLKEYALQQALSGEARYEGYKVVAGTARRKYTDETAVAEKLMSEGWDEVMLYEKKLLGLTAMEKMVGKKRFTELCGDLIIKPDGAPTLVPVTDKRPELNSAQEDFK